MRLIVLLIVLAVVGGKGSPDQVFRLDPAAAIEKAEAGAADLTSRLGVNIHSLRDERALDMAKSAGFSFVRTDLVWEKVERQGRYDFSALDGLMKALDQRGMGVLWILDYGHPEHGGKQPHSKKDFAAYARFAAAAVAHFRGRKARFEIWNEPNGKQFLPDASVYPELLKSALKEIRRGDPEAVVSTGGTSGIDLPFLQTMLKSGATQKASAVAVHPYRASKPETAIEDVAGLRELIRQNIKSNPPVWNSEWGYSSYGTFPGRFEGGGHSGIARRRQAIYAVREILTGWMLRLPVMVWYDLRDDGPDPFNPEQNFGLLDQNIGEKPAMKAVRVLTNASRDRHFAGMLRNLPDGIHILRLDGSDEMFIVWNENPARTMQMGLPANGAVTCTDMLGSAIPVSGAEIKLEEAAGPIYVRVQLPH